MILVRHGQSEANAKAIFAGHSDFDLTELGRHQAELVATYLCETQKIDKIYSSDLKRAYNTALPTAKRMGLEIIADKRLREVYAGLWEAQPTEYIKEKFPKDFECWMKDFSHVRCTGGESIVEVYNRIVPAICDISEKNDGKTVLVATHATVVRSFNAYAMGLAADETADSPYAVNASIAIYEMDKERVLSSEFNITEHLKGIIASPTKFNA